MDPEVRVDSSALAILVMLNDEIGAIFRALERERREATFEERNRLIHCYEAWQEVAPLCPPQQAVDTMLARLYERTLPRPVES
jgi:hypothetical protein